MTPEGPVGPVTWWATCGSLYTLVEAVDERIALHRATWAFQRAGRHRRDQVKVRPATPADLERWEALLAQEATIRAELDGPVLEPGPGQGDLFGGAA